MEPRRLELLTPCMPCRIFLDPEALQILALLDYLDLGP